MPARAITLYAKWTANSYTVTYESSGGSTVDAASVSYGANLTEPTTTRAGYTFGGWYKDEERTELWSFAADQMPARAITLYAKWTLNSYTVTYESSGGSTVDAASVSYGEHLTEPTTTRAGYTFGGWYKDEERTELWSFAADQMPARAITLYAKWTLNSYTVTYESSGGSTVDAASVSYGEHLTEPTTTRVGYTFGGWYKDEELIELWSFAADQMPARAITLYAKWTANSYTVTYESSGGSTVDAASVSYGANLTEPTTTRAGYTFGGWYKDEERTELWSFAADQMPARAITLYAKWTANIDSITATPATVSLRVGATQGLSIQASYTDASETTVTASAVYTSSNMAVATVDTAGVVTALKAGKAEITVSFEGETVVVQVTVTSSGGSGGTGNVSPTPTPTEPTSPEEPAQPTQPTVTQPIANDKVNVEILQAIVDRAQQAPNMSFSDVPATLWSAAAIERAARMGFVSGYSDGTFKPEQSVTRAEFATMVMKAFGLTATSTAVFHDVEGHWAADAIGTLNSIGIIQGYSDDRFRPNQEITRAEIVVILSRLTNYVPSKPAFTDVAANYWAADEIGAFAAAEIVTGKGEHTFKPTEHATRAESVAILIRLMDKLLLLK